MPALRIRSKTTPSPLLLPGKNGGLSCQSRAHTTTIGFGVLPALPRLPAREQGYDQWQTLGLQGIADICQRLDLDNNEQLLSRAIDQLPLPSLAAFAAQLEHQIPTSLLSQSLSGRLHREIETGNCPPSTLAALLRGLSLSHGNKQRQDALCAVLASHYRTDVEVLIAIASRCWSDLKQPEICSVFLEALAGNNSGQACFNRILADLVFIPGMRPHIMNGLRNPERSDQLAQALGGFFWTDKASINSGLT